MIDIEKLQILLGKRKDKFKILQETFNLTANLLNIEQDKLSNDFNTALTKVLSLLELEAQSRRTTGQILNNEDYKAIGIFQNRIKKLKNNRKSASKELKLIKLMPKLYKIKTNKNLSFRQLSEFINEKYGLKINYSYLSRIYKKINN
jgi:transposase